MVYKLLFALYKWIKTRYKLDKDILIINQDIAGTLPVITEWVLQYENVPNVSGEWKRHQVYAKAIKEYPDMKKRDLALSIEICIARLEL